MTEPDAIANPVEELSAEFVERLRRGERPLIEEYVARCPQRADEIRSLFPTVAALEQLRIRKERSSDGRATLGPKKLTRLGDLKIVREIGRGGMGLVYEAIQESLDRRVAVKVLARHARLEGTHRQRFHREARTAGRLHHTNIVPVLGVGEHDGFDFYVMQFIEGVGLDVVVGRLKGARVGNPGSVRLSTYWRPTANLSDQFARAARPPEANTQRVDVESTSLPRTADNVAEPGSVPPPSSSSPTPASKESVVAATGASFWHDVASVGSQVAQALDYAHRQRILHRDVKPANLLIDAQGTVWVTDFGLAKVTGQETVSRTGEVLGTLHYMAPEQWRGQADARSDVYSLGVTLYELLTLKLPHEPHGRHKTLGGSSIDLVATPIRQLVSNIPRDLETIVMKAIAEEPERRYQTAGELAADLESFLHDQPIVARRPSIVERFSRWSRRNPAVAGLSALSVTLLLLVAIVTSAGYARTHTAFRRESQQRARAETRLAVALEALDRVFATLVPERLGATSSLSAGDGPAGSTTAQAVISPETASLLEQLLPLYDRLAEQESLQTQLRRESARAIRRVGDIHLRLGNAAPAEAAYRRAIAAYTELASADTAEQDRLELARLHNQLGVLFARQPNSGSLRDEHRKALALLDLNPAQAASAEERFELARTLYLLGRAPDPQIHLPNQGGPGDRPPPHDGPPPPRPGEGRPPFDFDGPSEGPAPGRPRPDERRPGPGGRRPSPPEERGFESLSDRLRMDHPKPDRQIDEGHLQRAIDILNVLAKEHADNPDYRYLLALCQREIVPHEVIPEIAETIRLLTELVNEYPGVADYRYELASSLSMFDVREVQRADAVLAEERLRAALAQSTQLVDEHPYAPDYALLHIHVSNKLGRILRQPPERHEDGPDRLNEASELYDQAIRRQIMLIGRFPNDRVHHFWLAKLRDAQARLMLQRGQFDKARSVVETAITDFEQAMGSTDSSSLFKQLTADLYRILGEILHELGDNEAARQAHDKSRSLRSPPL